MLTKDELERIAHHGGIMDIPSLITHIRALDHEMEERSQRTTLIHNALVAAQERSREQDAKLARALGIIEKCEVADLRRLGLLDEARALLAANPPRESPKSS